MVWRFFAMALAWGSATVRCGRAARKAATPYHVTWVHSFALKVWSRSSVVSVASPASEMWWHPSMRRISRVARPARHAKPTSLTFRQVEMSSWVRLGKPWMSARPLSRNKGLPLMSRLVSEAMLDSRVRVRFLKLAHPPSLRVARRGSSRRASTFASDSRSHRDTSSSVMFTRTVEGSGPVLNSRRQLDTASVESCASGCRAWSPRLVMKALFDRSSALRFVSAARLATPSSDRRRLPVSAR
mmetsp:Transcript_16741/g.42384  ORF Transcript_16741/g.42384 Transcript_16741/m.42384 type:complete len:242 (+) Transcript_16741:296-1021(+)